MKSLILSALCVFAAQSFAAEKICFGSGDVKGERFNLTATKKKATIKDWKSDRFDWEVGTSESYSFIEEKTARNGEVYLTYEMPNSDGTNTLYVEESLLKAGTEGTVKIRWEGESFIQDTFFCRDEK